MSEKTILTPQLVDATYTHSLSIECTQKRKVGTIWPMDLVFMSTFDNQSMGIGCVGKLGGQSGFLRHYLLNDKVSFLVFDEICRHKEISINLCINFPEDDRPLSPVAACNTAWKVLSDQSSMESSFNESATGRLVFDM